MKNICIKKITILLSYKVFFFYAVLTVWFFTGCSSYNVYSDQAEYYENINEKVEGKEVKVTYVNGESLKVKDFFLLDLLPPEL